ncbi:MAG: hypothetical protein ACOYNF_14180, partial [Rhodoferax sp.]
MIKPFALSLSKGIVIKPVVRPGSPRTGWVTLTVEGQLAQCTGTGGSGLAGGQLEDAHNIHHAISLLVQAIGSGSGPLNQGGILLRDIVELGDGLV